VFLGS